MDKLDSDIVRGLFADPRISWAELAVQVNSSAKTVARRFKKMEEERTIKVVGEMPWNIFSDSFPVHVWIDVAGSSFEDVLKDISDLPTTQLVAAVYGDQDLYSTIHCENEAMTFEILEKIHRMHGVRSISSMPVLSCAFKASGWKPYSRFQNLTDSSQVKLNSYTPGKETIHQLTDAEIAIMRVLQKDCRLGASEIERLTGVSKSAAHRVITKILEDGLLRPRVELDLSRIGLLEHFVLRIETVPSQANRAMELIAAHPSTRFVSMVAGTAQIVVTGVAEDRQHLAELLSEDFAKVEGVRRITSNIFLKETKRYWIKRDSQGRLGEFNPPPLT